MNSDLQYQLHSGAWWMLPWIATPDHQISFLFMNKADEPYPKLILRLTFSYKFMKMFA